MHRALTAAFACSLAAVAPAAADTAPARTPLVQSWSDTGAIAVDDDWSRVPAVVGHRGDGLTAEPGVDPRAVVADGSATPVDVSANRTDPRAVGLAAGVAEFELADPVVAIQGSATASAPHLVLSLDTRGRNAAWVRLALRDVDASAADAVQPVAVQYRVGASGDFALVPGGYAADATTGPGEAVAVTHVRTELPAAAHDRPLVQVRVITTNAAGQDEWVGVDDIEVTAIGARPGTCTPAPSPPPSPQPPAPGPAPGGPSRPGLALTELRLEPDSFRPAARGRAIVRRGGARLRFRLSRAAVVRFSVVRASDDVVAGRFTVRSRRGLNRLRFSGRLRGRPLAPGAYVLRGVAIDRAGRESAPATVRFRIGGAMD
jgi:hypothetical protein